MISLEQYIKQKPYIYLPSLKKPFSFLFLKIFSKREKSFKMRNTFTLDDIITNAIHFLFWLILITGSYLLPDILNIFGGIGYVTIRL